MKILVTALLTVLLTLGALWLGLSLFAESGSLNVAATEEPIARVQDFFDTLSTHSIREHTRQAVDEGRITPPAEVTESVLATGASHFTSMCVVCHGAPGVERGEIGKGLSPQPPDLSHAAGELEATEIYWVVEHGIRHTGMPAFGPTHGEEELWAIASFVDRLDEMSPEEYRRRTAGASAGSASGDSHGDHAH